MNCLIMLLIGLQMNDSSNNYRSSDLWTMAGIVAATGGLACTGWFFLKDSQWARWTILLVTAAIWLFAVFGFVQILRGISWEWQLLTRMWRLLAHVLLCNILFLWLGWRVIHFLYALPRQESSGNQHTLRVVVSGFFAAMMLMASSADHIASASEHGWWTSGPGFYAQITHGGFRFYGFYGWGAWHVALFAVAAILLLGIIISLSRANIGIAIVRFASYAMCGLFTLATALFVHLLATQAATVIPVPVSEMFKLTIGLLIVWLGLLLAILCYWLGDSFRRLQA